MSTPRRHVRSSAISHMENYTGRASSTKESGQYSIELCCESGEGAGADKVLRRFHSLPVARAMFKSMIAENPAWLVMLLDGDRVLGRSDRPETVPR